MCVGDTGEDARQRKLNIAGQLTSKEKKGGESQFAVHKGPKYEITPGEKVAEGATEKLGFAAEARRILTEGMLSSLTASARGVSPF